nr:hypothetical 31.6 kDa protein in TAR-I ttuC' 3'region [Bradyrhizobium sp. DOA9]
MRRSIVGTLRPRHALDGPSAEPQRVLGELLLERIGRERGDHRAAAGENTENGTEHGAAQDRRRRIGQILPGRHQAGDLLLNEIAVHLGAMVEIANDLGKAEHAHRHRRKAEAVGKLRNVEGHARGAGLDVRTDHRKQQAEHDHRNRLQHRPLGQHHREDQAKHHQREIFGRAERQCELRQGCAEQCDQDGRDAAGEERADRGDRQRGAGTPLLRHLVAVDGGHHRCRLAGYVDQDRRGRAAILRAVIDAGEHDQRAHRRQSEGDRQQHRDGRDGANTREHADQRADQGADQTHQKVDRSKRDGKAVSEVGKNIHHALTASGNAGTSASAARARRGTGLRSRVSGRRRRSPPPATVSRASPSPRS